MHSLDDNYPARPRFETGTSTAEPNVSGALSWRASTSTQYYHREDNLLWIYR